MAKKREYHPHAFKALMGSAGLVVDSILVRPYQYLRPDERRALQKFLELDIAKKLDVILSGYAETSNELLHNKSCALCGHIGGDHENPVGGRACYALDDSCACSGFTLRPEDTNLDDNVLRWFQAIEDDQEPTR